MLKTLFFLTSVVVLSGHTENGCAQIHEVDDSYYRTFDSLLNSYRRNLGLSRLTNGDELKGVGEHHCEYICRLLESSPSALPSHDEKVKVDGVRSLGNTENRFAHFGITSEYGECLVYVSDSTVASPEHLLKMWENSKPHDQLIRTGGFNRYALSVMYFESEQIVTIGVLVLTVH